MLKVNESNLSQLLLKDANLRLIEPQIYSVSLNTEEPNFFDKLARFYDLVICNPFYNRLVWGYSVTSYATFIQQSLISSSDGWILDAGCGSLAFTAKTYIKYSERPVVLLDQSLKLLKIAKSRIIKLNGNVPTNMVFIHGDALQLPFKPESFNTIISLNLLHVLNDLDIAIQGFRNVMTAKGTMSFTTLVKNDRLADKYFERFEKAGEVIARNIGEIQAVFDALGMPLKYNIVGNLAFINCALD